MAANSVNFTHPLSTAELSTRAADFEYDSDVPLRYWFRTADALHKQAQFYERDGDDQHAYLLYMRYVLLIFEKLPTHPEAKQPANKKLLNAANKTVQSDLVKLEALKPGLNQRAQRYEQALVKRREAREEAATVRGSGADLSGDMAGLALHQRSESLTGPRKTVEAREHTDLAAKLARRERRRRLPNAEQGLDTTRRSSRHEYGDDLSKQLIEAGRRGQLAVAERNGSLKGTTPAVSAKVIKYPSVPGRSVVAARDEVPQRPPKDSVQRDFSFPPTRPPKQNGTNDLAPSVPPKLESYTSADISPPNRSSTSTPDINPREFTFKPSAILESGIPLRTMFIPPSLRSTFLKLASYNTSINQESLGILCGTLISNAFFITRLVLPPQTSTSDTCEMTSDGEIALWSHCDTNDLLTLGWIHTHPTQTCFMSSRDLHTHSGYQAQMAESIAIVCAPRHEPTWGAFRLTDPPGLGHVLGCKQTGIFHPHSEGNLYTDAMKPGHVCELPGLEFEVVDLR